MSFKGKSGAHDVKSADFYSSSQYEAISKSLDEFCGRVCELSKMAEDGPKYLYQQVVFAE